MTTIVWLEVLLISASITGVAHWFELRSCDRSRGSHARPPGERRAERDEAPATARCSALATDDGPEAP